MHTHTRLHTHVHAQSHLQVTVGPGAFDDSDNSDSSNSDSATRDSDSDNDNTPLAPARTGDAMSDEERDPDGGMSDNDPEDERGDASDVEGEANPIGGTVECHGTTWKRVAGVLYPPLYPKYCQNVVVPRKKGGPHCIEFVLFGPVFDVPPVGTP